MAMLNKGVRQGQLNQSEQAIQTYNDLIAYVGDDQTPALREQVVKAMVNKGVRQGQLQSKQEIQTYNDLIAYVGVSKRVLSPLTATIAAPVSFTSLMASTVKVGVITSALLEVNDSPALPVASLKPCSVNATKH
ncbi:hypothetical protein [Vibrio vulnificus]|uniref:hypothetical protein n=1 Tax=Vibrio vulnificus TaxID=672 RepID=UPI001593BC68|nr:hypothetical protein [Vibrio vulnificus]NVC43733.1 hypothetical protein [Vibrio vulnificus]